MSELVVPAALASSAGAVEPGPREVVAGTPQWPAFIAGERAWPIVPPVRGADEAGYEMRFGGRKPRHRHARSELLLLGLLLGLSCHGAEGAGAPAPPLRVAASHSLQESGLFETLAAEFTRRTNRPLQPRFVGTGEALELGRAGLADLVWVHSRPREDAFVSEGYGINRRDVMHSEFVIVGPPSDPARIEGLASAVVAFERLSRAGAGFISRGDRSGTHGRELALLKLASIDPDASWYTSLDAAMLPTLVHASERGAYALTDLPTYVAHRRRLDLKVLVSGDPRLYNAYGIIAVNPTRVPGTDYAGAMELIDFVTSPPSQAMIGDFGRAEYAVSLFHPSAEPGSSE
jgi:tungstate transport system substrate-binding protein